MQDTDFGAWVSAVVHVKCGDMVLDAYLDRGRDGKLRWRDDETGAMLKNVSEWSHLD